MKHLLTILAFYLFTGAHAESDSLAGILPMRDGKVMYTGIITIDTVSKSELYTRVKLHLSEMYKSSKDAIQVDDKDAGMVVIKGNFQSCGTSVGQRICMTTWHSYKIFIKDGKVKYEITDFVFRGLNNGVHYNEPVETYNPAMAKKYRLMVLADIDRQVQSMIAQLTLDVNKKPAGSDW